ncbi:hypothetical protein KAT36_01820 [Candidatus Pacearchaeota archaeon]|nr:hypothetical protein [Candidatus Pacearchaeota archaeon]
MANKKKLQEKNLNILVTNDGFDFTDTFFPYTSGKIGPYFVQSGAVMNNGRNYASAARDMTDLIHDTVSLDKIDIISGGETRDWIFSNLVVNNLVRDHDISKAHVMLYKNEKTVGASMAGKRILHVADLNNEGSSVRDYWIPIIKKAGGEISDVFFYVERMENGVQVVENLGLKGHAVVKLDGHAWDYLYAKGAVNNDCYWNLKARMEDKDSWAEKMLRSDAGVQKLKKILMDKKTLRKGQKILRVGYPYLKEELTDRLQKLNVPKELLSQNEINSKTTTS